ncbi:MAG TPA: hypothetical protein VGW38_20950, partial [Chloroflexota bacterium]|nr:hypothetical protein [Chloroflexota bacterium]
TVFTGRAVRLTAIAIGTVVAAGFVLRLFAATHFTPHVDEPSSLLAAHVVADTGLPVLPSGTIYLQGATLSYLLVPFIWLGRGELQDLHLMRLVVAAVGTAAIVLSF